EPAHAVVAGGDAVEGIDILRLQARSPAKLLERERDIAEREVGSSLREQIADRQGGPRAGGATRELAVRAAADDQAGRDDEGEKGGFAGHRLGSTIRM